MATHKEMHLSNAHLETREDGTVVLKDAAVEKLITWVHGDERNEDNKGPEFNRQIILSQDYDGLPLRDLLEAAFRKYTIDARGRFRDQMELHKAMGFVNSLPEDQISEGAFKRAEWRVVGGTGQLFERPKTAEEIAAEIEHGDHSAEELDELITRLQEMKKSA